MKRFTLVFLLLIGFLSFSSCTIDSIQDMHSTEGNDGDVITEKDDTENEADDEGLPLIIE